MAFTIIRCNLKISLNIPAYDHLLGMIVLWITLQRSCLKQEIICFYSVDEMILVDNL